jgi:CBS domain-containing protein
MAKATVREAMTSSPHSIQSRGSAVEAARTMANENVGSLPVVDGENLVGMVTDRDLVTQVLAKDLDPSKVTVSEVCSENPIVASPDEPLDQALQRMAQEQVRRLPVVADGRLVGILAQADVARTAKPTSTGEMVEQISQN